MNDGSRARTGRCGLPLIPVAASAILSLSLTLIAVAAFVGESRAGRPRPQSIASGAGSIRTPSPHGDAARCRAGARRSRAVAAHWRRR